MRDNPESLEAVCEKCDFFITKPGGLPAHLAALIIQAHRMEALFESGAAVAYPDFYTTLEWEAFLALKGARAKDQEKDFPKKKEGATDPESEIRRLQQRLGQQ